MDTDGKGSFQSRFSKLFNKTPDKISAEDILFMLELAEQQGVLLANQRKMIANVLEFRNTTVEDVMTHRVEIEAVEENAKISDVLRIAIDNGFSRIPVYKEDIDNIIGVVYVKDLLTLVCAENAAQKPVSRFIREVFYVPETIKCWDLFHHFTDQHQHLAVVVDEYGGTSGIATLEDVLETIVGQIQDEYDNEQAEITKINATTYIMDGAADLDKVSDTLGVRIEENPDYDTIGGFLVDQLGQIPEAGEHPVIRYADVEFTVLVVEERHIAKVRAVVRDSQIGVKKDEDSEF